MELLRCALYLSVLGAVFHFLGNAYPRERFLPDRYPYRCQEWEQEGRIYRRIGVHRWKDYMPDSSRFCSYMYRKKVLPGGDAENLRRLVQETCVAELVHYQLIVFSLPVIRFYPGWGGWVIWGLCIVGNLLFVVIQRYNRPRLQRALKRAEGKAAIQESDRMACPIS